MTIAERFDYAADFSEGLAALSVDDKWGFMRNQVLSSLPTIYRAYSFSDRLAIIYTDVKKEMLTPHVNPRFSDYWEYRFIDKTGRCY